MPARHETTVPPREVELKFQLLPGSEEILRADDVFGPAVRRVHQITTYNDTPDSLLLSAGLTLRVRAANGQFVQTVKSRDDGLTLASSRNECEWPVANSTPQIGKLAGVVELASIAEKLADWLEPVIPLESGTSRTQRATGQTRQSFTAVC